MADIVRTRIFSAEHKLRFLPYAFDIFFLQAENYVTNFMHQYAESYDGGLWEYVVMPNGACAFIAPDSYSLSLPNCFNELVSAKETGIIVALYAFNHYYGMAFES